MRKFSVAFCKLFFLQNFAFFCEKKLCKNEAKYCENSVLFAKLSFFREIFAIFYEIFAFSILQNICIFYFAKQIEAKFCKKRKFSHFLQANEMQRQKEMVAKKIFAKRFFLFTGNPSFESQIN